MARTRTYNWVRRESRLANLRHSTSCLSHPFAPTHKYRRVIGAPSASTQFNPVSNGDPGRDPRLRAVAVVYWGAVNDTHLDEAPREEQSRARLVPVKEFTSDNFRFAFDHAHIATDAINALHHSLTHTSTATRICKPTFTMRDLQHVYEVVFDTDISAGNFHRKILNTPGFVEPVHSQPPNPKTKGRPPQYFQASQIVDLSPAFHFEKNPKSRP